MSDVEIPSAQQGHFQPIRFALRTRPPLAWATIAFAVLGLILGLAPIHAVVQPFLGTAAIHPLTAVCLIGLAGSILLTKRYETSSHLRFGLLGIILALCTMRVMAAALVSFAGIASISAFGPMTGFVGTFSLEIAIALAALAAAGLLRQGNGRWGSAFLFIGLFCIFNMVLGGVFGVRTADRAHGFLAVLAMTCGAAAMVSMYLHRPFVRVVFLIGDVGSQTRVMAGAVLAVPVGATLVLNQFDASGGMAAIEVTLLAMVCCLMLIILLATSAHHEGSVATRRRAEHDIAMRSRTDELTGALNRSGMTEVVEGAWLEYKSAGVQFGMIMLDLEYFRRLDATFGHDDGEAVLGRVAQTVHAQLRGFDALGRWDKNEFMVLLKIKDIANMDIVADRLRGALVASDSPFCAGLSIEPARIDIALGMSAFLAADETAAMAITRADMNLNEVKSTGAQMAADLRGDSSLEILSPSEMDIFADPETNPEYKAAAA